ELIQPVKVLPRGEHGAVRLDALQLIAANRLDELELLMDREPELRAVLEPIVATRLNLTDRVFK
ncbi:MAG: serine/threonine protein kinase, partial [Pseudomonadota bacterium]